MFQKMHYKGESQNWNWDKHCKKFHHQILVIDEWAAASLATRMSEEDKINAFLKTIPKDCYIGVLSLPRALSRVTDHGSHPVSNVIPMHSPTIYAKECGAPVPKCMIVNTNTSSRSYNH